MKHGLAAAAALALFGCAHGGEPDIATLSSSSDQILWETAQKAMADRHWESARQHLKRIVDGFGQSEYGPAARLALGDLHFQEGGTANYILAISEYRDFLTLYPSHPKSDYAQFQVGECFFRQRNGPDRDQTDTVKALDEFQRLLDLYPNSSYVETARSRIVACRQSLARSEFMAGFFYQRTRQAYHAAVIRYQGIMTDYPDYEGLDEVLFRLAECLSLSGRNAEALPQLARLIESYPGSRFLEPARRLASEIAQKPATPPAANPTPSPTPTPTPHSPEPASRR